MLLCKDTVHFGGFKPGLIRILAALDQLSSELGEDIVITSGSDGEHMKTSRHYKFEALDIRSHAWKLDRKLAAKARLEQILGPRFTVLLEDAGTTNEHLHAQVRKGLSYP